MVIIMIIVITGPVMIILINHIINISMITVIIVITLIKRTQTVGVPLQPNLLASRRLCNAPGLNVSTYLEASTSAP
jgi:hypothetical protein